MTTFVDTNVLISITNSADTNHKWSIEQLNECRSKGPAVICDMVYCEFSIGMSNRQAVDTAVSKLALERFGRSSDEMLIRAGQAYKQYKANKGGKNNVLPDFLIGAVAEIVGAPLLTADTDNYKTYFPSVTLISP